MKVTKKFLLAALACASLTAGAFGIAACDTVDDNPSAHTHTWSEWAATTAPTDANEGKATRTCSGAGNCDASAADREYTLPALTSSYYTKNESAATCTEAGSITYTYNRDAVKVSFAVATGAKGHGELEAHASNVSCTVDGYASYWTCPDCNWLFSDAAGEHKIDAPVAVTARGTHGNLTKTEAVADTDCTASGTAAYWTCDDCGWLFSDEAGEHKIDAPVVLNHPNAVKTDGEDATCTDDGHKAYWTCPDCNKTFEDEACTDEVLDTDDLTLVKVPHDLEFNEGWGATCDSEGQDDYWECSECKKQFSDEEGTVEIDAPVTRPTHPIAEKHTAAAKTYSGVQFIIPNMYYCSDCREYVIEKEDENGKSVREVYSSGLLYVSTAADYHLLFDKEAGVTAEVDLSNEEQYKGVTFVAPENKTSIYTFSFVDASITKVVYRQGTENVTVYENGAWTNAAVVSKFNTASATLAGTVTFEAAKNDMVIISLSSSKFSATYSFETSYNVYLNTAYLIEPTASEKSITLTAVVPTAGTYLLTVSNLSMYFDSTAAFEVATGEDTQTAKAVIPISVTLAPNAEFKITITSDLFATHTYNYTIAITPEPKALAVEENTVAVTVANSTINTDAYYFVADTDKEEGEAYNFEVSAGLTAILLERGVTVTSAKVEKIILTPNEKVTVVVKAATVGNHKLTISKDEEGWLYETISVGESKSLTVAANGGTGILQANVETGTYQITITGYNTNQHMLYFGKNAYNGTSFDTTKGLYLTTWMSSSGDYTVISKAMTNCVIQVTLEKGDTLEICNLGRGEISGVTLALAAV